MTGPFDLALASSSLVDLLRRRAQHRPDRRAYTFLTDGEAQEVHLAYGELDRQARAIGVALQRLGAAGERVLLLYPQGLDYIAAFFGCLYAGAVAVPAYPPRPNRPTPRLQAIVTDAQPLVTLATAEIIAQLEGQPVHTPYLETLHRLASDRLPRGAEEGWRDSAARGATLAFLQYTSGSTATPKGVMVSHGNLLANSRMIQQAFGHTEDSVQVSWLPLFHDMGLIMTMLQAAYIGAPCTIMSPAAFVQRPIRWLQAISRYRARTSGAPNFAYDLCARKIPPAQREALDLSVWRVAFNGAEPVRRDTLERFAEAFAPCGLRREALNPCYGLAEATVFVSGSPGVRSVGGANHAPDWAVAEGAPGDARAPVGCGRAWGDETLKIVDPASSTPRAPGEVGEIWVGGSNVARGYWRRPEETEQTFGASLAGTGAGPFLRTGDLGFMWDGELFVTGRHKDLIIVHGNNHYPQDIELTVERSHPALRPAYGAAFTVETAGEERLVVVQEVERADRNRDLGEAVEAIRRAVADEHEPQVSAVALIRPGHIAKTSSGKIQRWTCHAQFLDGSLDSLWLWSLDAPREHRDGREDGNRAEGSRVGTVPALSL